MAVLKQEITNRGIQGVIPNPDDETNIQELDPVALLELQAMFGQMVMGNARLEQLLNRTAPVLFATLLFTVMEEYQVDPNDEDSVIPTKDIFEAESAAIGMVRSVAAAFGKLSGDLTVEPSDAEVDADTEINPV